MAAALHDSVLSASVGAISPSAKDFALDPDKQDQRDELDKCLAALRKAEQLIRASDQRPTSRR